MSQSDLKKIHLVGTDHEAQWDIRDIKATKLYARLAIKIKESKIDLIGEEFFEGLLLKQPIKVEETTAQRISNKYNVKHAFCEPDENTRKELGVLTQKQLRKKFGTRSAIEGTNEHAIRKEFEKSFWPIKEGYWLNQINKTNCKNIIFICGASHLKSFGDLLTGNGNAVTVDEL